MEVDFGHESPVRPFEDYRAGYHVTLLRYALDADGKCVRLTSSTRGYQTMAAAEEMGLLYSELGKYTEVSVYDGFVRKRIGTIQRSV